MSVDLVSISEAAKLLDVAEITIRRRLRSGEINGQKRSTPQGFVWMVEVCDETIQQKVEHRERDGRRPPNSEGAPEEPLLRELVEFLKDELKTRELSWKEQLEAQNQQIKELHVLLQQAQAALPAPKENRQSWWRFWGR